MEETSPTAAVPIPRTRRRELELAFDLLRFVARSAATAPGTLLSVARGRREPPILDGSDFGGMRWQTHRVATAGSADELQRLLAEARAGGVPVTVAASRHSANGQTLPPAGGLQIRLDRESGRWPAPRMVDGTRVRVPAAHTWRTLQSFLRARGRTCPVLTDHLTTRIGGTLSVGGGIGTSSVAFGRQLDNVRELRLILPSGDAVRCAPDENAALFRHVMGGHGLLGVIDEVTLETRPYRPYLAVFRYQARSLTEAFVDELLRLRAEVDPQGLFGSPTLRAAILGSRAASVAPAGAKPLARLGARR